MRHRRIAAVLLIGTIFLVSSVAFAEQDKGEGDGAPGASVSLFLEQVDQAKRSGSNTLLGYTSVGAEFEWQFLIFEIDHRVYDWKTALQQESIQADDPWEKLTRIAPGAQYYRELSGRWSVWAKFMAYSSFEDEMSSDSWTYSPQIVGFYKLESPIMLYGGLGIRYHPVDAVVYPIAGVAWGVKSKRGFSGNVGFPDTELRYGITEKMAVLCTLEWDIRIYRLAESSDLASGGYLRVEDIIPGIKVTYEPADGQIVYAGVRGYFGRQLTVFDQDEMERDAGSVEDAWAFRFGLDYRF